MKTQCWYRSRNKWTIKRGYISSFSLNDNVPWRIEI